MIKLEHVSKSYENGTTALMDMSFTMEDGEFAFLVGPSGSGKSTIIKLLTGEVAPTEGKVYVNGFEPGSMPRRKLPKMRRTIGIIFQDFRLIPDKTVFENVALAMHVVGASRAEIKERVPYVLSLVGLKDEWKKKPTELSGGEQQRVAIARALANNTKTIVADEPTGNIDPYLSEELMKLLARINETGVTILVVTHERELVNRFDKRVIQIKNGLLIRDGKGWD